MIDQNASHGLGRDGEEMGPVLVRDYLTAKKPDTEFVDQGTGLQRMVRSFPLQEIRRYLPQLDMDAFEQSLASPIIAAAPAKATP